MDLVDGSRKKRRLDPVPPPVPSPILDEACVALPNGFELNRRIGVLHDGHNKVRGVDVDSSRALKNGSV
jgi:hypothetical protein